jgi:hypothetical protein
MIGAICVVHTVPCVCSDVGGQVMSHIYVIGSCTVVSGVGVHVRDYSAGLGFGAARRQETHPTMLGKPKRDWGHPVTLAFNGACGN